MRVETTVYVDEVKVRENSVDASFVRFLRTENELWLAHVDIDEAVHALVYPSEPIVKTSIINLKLAARFFRGMFDYQRTLDKVLEDVFGEAGEVTNRYMFNADVPLHKSPYTKGGKPMARTEEMARYQEMNSMENRAVPLPILELLSRIKPPSK